LSNLNKVFGYFIPTNFDFEKEEEVKFVEKQ
jgi:hypothetical protein